MNTAGKWLKKKWQSPNPKPAMALLFSGTLLLSGWTLGGIGVKPTDPPNGTAQSRPTKSAAKGYLPDESCRNCHQDLFDQFQNTPKGQSFRRPAADNLIEDFASKPFFHQPSGRYYQVTREENTIWFSRWQTNADGDTSNLFRTQIDWILGSGSQVRTYLFQNKEGALIRLPIAWYPKRNEWAMAPEFDIPNPPGINVLADRNCMFCHNAYPDVPKGTDHYRQAHNFPAQLPQGIGCQRCHGPGEEHVRLANQAGQNGQKVAAAILNPKHFDATRQNDTCNQCHLTPNSKTLTMTRFGKRDYGYQAGQRLTDFRLTALMPHGSSTTEPVFYQQALALSACSTHPEKTMTCMTCHKAHGNPSPEAKKARVREACLSCHEASAPHPSISQISKPMTAFSGMGQCTSCHLPALADSPTNHGMRTDHRIPRKAGQVSSGNDTSAQTAQQITFLDLPENLKPSLLNLYKATAAHRWQNSAETLNQLETTWKTANSNTIEPIYDVVIGLLARKQFKKAEFYLGEILERRTDDLQAMEWIAVAKAGLGKSGQSVNHLNQVLNSDPNRADAHYNLGRVKLSQGDFSNAVGHLRAALDLRPNLASAWFHLGRTYRQMNRIGSAEIALLKALSVDPGMESAYLVLGIMLLEQEDTDSARRVMCLGLESARTTGQLRKTLIRYLPGSL